MSQDENKPEEDQSTQPTVFRIHSSNSPPNSQEPDNQPSSSDHAKPQQSSSSSQTPSLPEPSAPVLEIPKLQPPVIELTLETPSTRDLTLDRVLSQTEEVKGPESQDPKPDLPVHLMVVPQSGSLYYESFADLEEAIPELRVKLQEYQAREETEGLRVFLFAGQRIELSGDLNFGTLSVRVPGEEPRRVFEEKDAPVLSPGELTSSSIQVASTEDDGGDDESDSDTFFM